MTSYLNDGDDVLDRGFRLGGPDGRGDGLTNLDALKMRWAGDRHVYVPNGYRPPPGVLPPPDPFNPAPLGPEPIGPPPIAPPPL